MNSLIALIIAAAFSFRDKISVTGFVYLNLLPFVLFSGLPPFQLLLSLILGVSLYLLFTKPSFKKFIIFFAVLIAGFVILKPRPGLDSGLINSINAQRGEHPQYLINPVSKIIHNKSELIHSFITNFDVLLSPVAIFASGFWHHLNPYYPLGFLFPWDIYLLYHYFKHRKTDWPHKRWLYPVIALLSLFLIAGFVYVDQALIFSLAFVYFLALLAANSYRTLSPKAQRLFLLANVIFLIYQKYLVSLFKI